MEEEASKEITGADNLDHSTTIPTNPTKTLDTLTITLDKVMIVLAILEDIIILTRAVSEVVEIQIPRIVMMME